VPLISSSGRQGVHLLAHRVCQAHTLSLPVIVGVVALAVVAVLLDPTLRALSIFAGAVDGP